jgi:Tol biopolymer transport system component
MARRGIAARSTKANSKGVMRMTLRISTTRWVALIATTACATACGSDKSTQPGGSNGGTGGTASLADGAVGHDGGAPNTDAGHCVNALQLPGKLYYARTSISASGGEIWVRSDNGKSDVRVTTGSRPILSPNGRYLGFFRNGANGTAEGSLGDVWIRDLTSGTELKVFTNTDYARYGSFTADSTKLLFDFKCGWDIVNVDGTGLATFRSGGTVIANEADAGASDAGSADAAVADSGQVGGCLDDAPAVRPDGTMIAFRNSERGLGIENFDGSGATYFLAHKATHFQNFPRWSKDGQWLSYIDDVIDDGAGDLHKVHPDGTGELRLTAESDGGRSHFLGAGVWTDDGTHLLVAGSVGGVNGIYGMPTELNDCGPVRVPITSGAQVEFVGAYTAL